MPYPGPDKMDQTMAEVMRRRRIAGQNPEGHSDQGRVDNAAGHNEMTLQSMAEILSRTPEAREKGLSAGDFFTALINDGRRLFMGKETAADMNTRGVPTFNTSTAWADSELQSLDERLQTDPARNPILGPQNDIRRYRAGDPVLRKP